MRRRQTGLLRESRDHQGQHKESRPRRLDAHQISNESPERSQRLRRSIGRAFKRTHFGAAEKPPCPVPNEAGAALRPPRPTSTRLMAPRSDRAATPAICDCGRLQFTQFTVPVIGPWLPAQKPRLTAFPAREILPRVPSSFQSFMIAARFCLPIEETALERIAAGRPAQ